MSRTKSDKAHDDFVAAVTNAVVATNTARRSSEMQTAIEQSKYLAAIIISSAGKAATVEQLTWQEMALQSLDVLMAHSEQDRAGIRNAQRDYMQVIKTVEQMRQSPQEYFRANESLKETGGDFKKMPRSRGLQQIQGNKARMQNRASFTPEEQQAIWQARITLAEKTEASLRELHNTLVIDHERLLKIRKGNE